MVKHLWCFPLTQGSFLWRCRGQVAPCCRLRSQEPMCSSIRNIQNSRQIPLQVQLHDVSMPCHPLLISSERGFGFQSNVPSYKAAVPGAVPAPMTDSTTPSARLRACSFCSLGLWGVRLPARAARRNVGGALFRVDLFLGASIGDSCGS